MKIFEEPKLTLEELEVEDVITASLTCDEYCSNDECDWDGGGF